MSQTLMWRTLPPKQSYLKFFPFLVLTSLFNCCSGMARVTKAVNDVAVLSCDYNISTEELPRARIYWQKYSEIVLTVIAGEKKVWPRYENRTFIDTTNNPSIVIMALRLSDNGTYTCVIQKLERGGYQKVHLTSVVLLVRADFPVPNITELGNQSTNIKRIICSTSGGFPKPTLSWLENGEELNAIHTIVSQDPESQLYTIRSELELNVTANHSVMCLVKYGNSTVSQIFSWQKPEESPPSPSPSLLLFWISCFVPVAVIVCAAVIAVTLRCPHCGNPAERGRSRNSGSIEMERISPLHSKSAEASR